MKVGDKITVINDIEIMDNYYLVQIIPAGTTGTVESIKTDGLDGLIYPYECTLDVFPKYLSFYFAAAEIEKV